MPDRDTIFPADAIREIADLPRHDVVRRVAAISVYVDVHAEILRHRKYALDLCGTVLVVTRCATDDRRATFEPFHDVRFGAGNVRPAFLEEHADLEIDAPGVVLREAPDRIEAAKSDIRIDFHVRAHVHDAVQDGMLQRLASARVGVFLRERVFDGRYTLHVIRGAPVFERRDAVEDARLVEMEMALHQSGRDEPRACIDARSVA